MTSPSTTQEQLPADELEAVFALPVYLRDHEVYAPLYRAMVARLRREASGLPMNHLQNILIERIASMYVIIRYNEDTQTWATGTQQKEFNDYWLKLTSEFNKLLAQGEDKRREQLVLDIQNMVLNALEAVTVKEDRQAARKMLSEGFASLDL